MQTTTNYGYNVPESGDAADITKVAQNFVDIDSDLKNIENTVNNTCSDLSEKIDEVGTKVDGVGKKVDSIQTSVEGLPTSLETDFTEVKNAISDVKTDVGNVNTTVSDVKKDTESIKNTVDSNPILYDKSVIKSIQTGAIAITGMTTEPTSKDITISQVNPEKCFVILQSNLGSGSTETHTECRLKTLTETTLTYMIRVVSKVSTGYNWPCQVSWQVIEFY